MFRFSLFNKHSSDNEAGYTLTELLVVLLVMGLLTSLSVPALKSVFPRVALSSAASQLEADLSHMRRSAMRHSEVYDLVLDKDARGYVIQKSGNQTKARTLSSNLEISSRQNTSPDLQSENPIIRVLPNGQFVGGTVLLKSGGSVTVIKPDVSGRRLNVSSQ